MDKKFVATFLICSLLLYSVLSLWRCHSVEQTIEEETLLLERKRVEILNSIREDEEAYLQALPSKSYFSPNWDVFQDPQVATFVINSHVQVKELELRYRTESLLDVLTADEIPLSPYVLFHIYGKLYSFDNLRLSIGLGTSLGWNKLGPYLENDTFSRMAAAIETWEVNGGVREGDWFQKFQDSPEYAVFVDSLLKEIRSPEPGKTVDEMAAEIQNIPIERSLGPSNSIRSYFLKDAKIITSMIYNSYLVHIDERDFVSANVDAWIIYSIWKRAHYAETITFWHYYDLKESGFFPDPMVDLIIIVVVALMITLIVRYVFRSRQS